MFSQPFLSLLHPFLLFLSLFSAPYPVFVFYNLLTVLRGCFKPLGLTHLSQSLALSPFISFFSSLFSFSSFPFLSSLLFLFSLSLSLQIFGVPSKALCRKIGSALWKIGSTDFLKMCEKDAFSCQISLFSAKTTIFGSKTIKTFSQIGPSWKLLEETLVATAAMPHRFRWTWLQESFSS